MHIESGVLQEARQCPSPNCDERPDSCVDLLVIHNISLPPGEFGGPHIDALFCNTLDAEAHAFFREIEQLEVSAHLLIRRSAEIVQYVPFHKRAWHAGVSNYCGRTACNDFSIGIEMEGTDDLPYEERQYKILASVVAALLQSYPAIDRSRIVGHSDIAPGRKTDPGDSFDWSYLHTLLDNREDL